MRLALAAVCAAAFCGFATPSFAQVSDADFIQASRCNAIARLDKFGSPDAQAFKGFLDAEAKGRTITARNRARQAASLAKQEGLTATGAKKAALEAELQGVCQAFKTQVTAAN
jgi:hypothetical protein